jgi:hypothetical protein
MKSRQVSFYVENERLPLLMETIQDEVLPQFQQLPHYLGITVIKADLGDRSEVIATSFWDDGLADSQLVSNHFVEEIVRVTGRNPSRKAFDILYAQVRDAQGALCDD